MSLTMICMKYSHMVHGIKVLLCGRPWSDYYHPSLVMYARVTNNRGEGVGIIGEGVKFFWKTRKRRDLE